MTARGKAHYLYFGQQPEYHRQSLTNDTLNGSLGSSIETLARWLPVGTVMTLFAGVLHLAAWSTRDTQ